MVAHPGTQDSEYKTVDVLRGEIREVSNGYEFTIGHRTWIIPNKIMSRVSIPIGGASLSINAKISTAMWEPWDSVEEMDKCAKILDQYYKRK